MLLRGRANGGDVRPAISAGRGARSDPAVLAQEAHAAEHAVAAGGREDDDPSLSRVGGVPQDGGEVGQEALHDARAVDDLLDDLYPAVGGEAWVHEGLWDDVAALLADWEEEGGFGGSAGVPFAVVVEDEAG